MKKKVELNICDFCGRSGYLQKCLVCKKEYCVVCGYSGIFFLKLCRKCSIENKKVRIILDKYEENWRKYNRKIEKLLTLKSN